MKGKEGFVVFNGHIFVLTGPSAAGKTTIMEGLINGVEIEGKKIKLIDRITPIITVTTRKPRPGEIDGEHYYFIDSQTFQKEKEAGNIVEETEYPKGSGVMYGIFDSEIQRIYKSGMDAIAILDMHGVEEMKRFYGAGNVISIFIYRRLEDILEELRKRPISEEEVQQRFAYAKEEMKNQYLCDYVVPNVGSILRAVIRTAMIIAYTRNQQKAEKYMREVLKKIS